MGRKRNGICVSLVPGHTADRAGPSRLQEMGFRNGFLTPVFHLVV